MNRSKIIGATALASVMAAGAAQAEMSISGYFTGIVQDAAGGGILDDVCDPLCLLDSIVGYALHVDASFNIDPGLLQWSDHISMIVLRQIRKVGKEVCEKLLKCGSISGRIQEMVMGIKKIYSTT